MPNYLSEMRSFALVADHGGFSAAARAAGVSKARLSQHVQRLEDALGVQLLHRSTRKVSLTRAGEEMLVHGQSVVNAQDAAFDAIEALAKQPYGSVGLTVPVSFGEMFMAEVIAAFQQTYPDIVIQLDLENRYQDLKSTAPDIAIRAGLPDDPDQVAIPLGQYSELTCASLTYFERIGLSPVDIRVPKDLEPLDCLVNHHACRDGKWTFFRDGDATAVPVRGPVSLNHFPLVRDAAIAGRGVARLPRYLAIPELRTGRLIELLWSYHALATPIYLVFIREDRIPRRVRVLVDFIRDWFRERPDLLGAWRQG